MAESVRYHAPDQGGKPTGGDQERALAGCLAIAIGPVMFGVAAYLCENTPELADLWQKIENLFQ